MFNLFGIFASKKTNSKVSKNPYAKIDISAYNNQNRVGLKFPASYTFDSFAEDLDKVINPKPLKNTEFIEI